MSDRVISSTDHPGCVLHSMICTMMGEYEVRGFGSIKKIHITQGMAELLYPYYFAKRLTLCESLEEWTASEYRIIGVAVQFKASRFKLE